VPAELISRGGGAKRRAVRMGNEEKIEKRRKNDHIIREKEAK
jgi:hypothetical protein